MTCHHINNYGTVEFLTDEIALLTADHGIEINEVTADEVMGRLMKQYPDGVKLIINKRHSYSIGAGVYHKGSWNKFIKAIAIVTYTRGSKMAAKLTTFMATYLNYKSIRTFESEEGIEAARRWLESLEK
ncbi:MAG: hypothetical protein ABW131_04985 [Candidatus Sedimenticola sp. 6PFRAG5]